MLYTTSVFVKEQFAKSILEFLEGVNFNYLFTEPVRFGETMVVNFIIQGNDEDVDFFKKWVKGAFSTNAAVIADFHIDSKNQLTDVFRED